MDILYCVFVYCILVLIESRFLEYEWSTGMAVSTTIRVRVCESLRIHYKKRLFESDFTNKKLKCRVQIQNPLGSYSSPLSSTRTRISKKGLECESFEHGSRLDAALLLQLNHLHCMPITWYTGIPPQASSPSPPCPPPPPSLLWAPTAP